LRRKGGWCLLGWFPNEEPGGSGNSLKKIPNLYNEIALFFRGLQALQMETIKKGNPLEGGGFFRSIYAAVCIS